MNTHANESIGCFSCIASTLVHKRNFIIHAWSIKQILTEQWFKFGCCCKQATNSKIWMLYTRLQACSRKALQPFQGGCYVKYGQKLPCCYVFKLWQEFPQNTHNVRATFWIQMIIISFNPIRHFYKIHVIITKQIQTEQMKSRPKAVAFITDPENNQ